MQKTSLFSTIGAVLDDALSDACRIYVVDEAEIIEAVQQHLRTNRAAYYGGEPVRLPYDDPLYRIAYIYTYVAAHAHLLEYSLGHFDATRELVHSQLESAVGSLEVCSLGGGPGSELLGLARYIQGVAQAGANVALTFCVVDRVTAWAESWRALVLGIEADMKKRLGARRVDWPFTVSHEFLQLDLTDSACLDDFTSRFAGVDLFVLNHVISELKGSESALAGWLSALVERSRENALFLVVDRNEAGMATEIRGILSEANLVVQDQRDVKLRLPSDEQKSDLGATWQKFD